MVEFMVARSNSVPSKLSVELMVKFVAYDAVCAVMVVPAPDAYDAVPANCEVLDPVYALNDPVVTKDPESILVPPIAADAVKYNCPEPVSIKTTAVCAVDDNPFRNTDPDVVNDPDIMG